MKSIQVIVHIAVALGVVASTHARSLEEGFKTPPPDARPQTWYHLMNGNVTKAGITRDFEEMARLGLGGVQIFDVGCDIPPGDVKFGSPEWFDLLRHAHNEAKRLGLKLGIHNCSGWSSSGGPWVTPADAMKVTMHAEFSATGPSRFSKKLSRIKKDNGFYADIAVLAYPTIEKGATLSNANGKTGRSRKGMSVELSSLARDTKEFPAAKVIAKDRIIDLTAKMSRDGTLTWDVPAGKWTIFRLGLRMGVAMARLAESQRAGNQGNPAVGEGWQAVAHRTPHVHHMEALDERRRATAIWTARPGGNRKQEWFCNWFG